MREVREDVNTQMWNAPGETSTHMVISSGEVRQTYVPLSPWVFFGCEQRKRAGGCLSLCKSWMQSFGTFVVMSEFIPHRIYTYIYIFTAVIFRFLRKSMTCINWRNLVSTILRKCRKTGGRAGFHKKKKWSDHSVYKCFNRKFPAYCADNRKLKMPNVKFKLYNCPQFLVSVILKFKPRVWVVTGGHAVL